MNEEATRYPLTWPTGWPRTQYRQEARFQSRADYSTNGHARTRLKLSDSFGRLESELNLLRASGVLVSSNLTLGVRGDPLANQPEPPDPGAAVYFKLKGKDRVLACDRWNRTAANLAAIAAHIKAIRAVDRYGVGTLDQAFAGYDRLPAPGADNRPAWRHVFKFGDSESVSAEKLNERYRAHAKAIADGGGDTHGAMVAINVARDMAMVEIGK